MEFNNHEITIKMKKYSNVFEQAEKHPKAQQFHEENLARITNMFEDHEMLQDIRDDDEKN